MWFDMVKHLETVDEVIAELGGTKAVAELTNRRKDSSAVLMWKNRRRFPTNTFTLLQPELERRNAIAPNKLWGMP